MNFVGQAITVETAANAPTPLALTWRGQRYVIARVLDEWVDTGYGPGHPARSRRWYTRHHRRHFTVQTAAGDVFEMYLDYADRSHRVWWLSRHTPATDKKA
jgi:hypothetical protein